MCCTELEEGVQPGLSTMSEVINKMMIHKSHLIAPSPECADSGAWRRDELRIVDNEHGTLGYSPDCRSDEDQ